MPTPRVDEAVLDPGFTPGRRHAPRLLELLVDDELAAPAHRALLRLGAPALPAALAAFPATAPPARGRLVDVVADLSPHDPAAVRAFLLERLGDADPKTRRNAVIGLARHETPDVERALLAYWRDEPRDDHRRSVARALGRVGGDASLALLRTAPADSTELARAMREAVLALERRAVRATTSRIDASLPFPEDVVLLTRCRPGFEALCGDEFPAGWKARVVGAGLVEVRPRGRLRDVYCARTMTSFGFPLPLRPIEGDAATALADALTADDALGIFRAFTDGAIRYRVEWVDAGHRRGATQRAVDLASARKPILVNDPRDATWEVVAREIGHRLRVELVPRRIVDPRFVYRKGDVPAASHPTLAATLARVAGVRPDDVVWDPFVGSGLELCERGILGPYARLCGSDLDADALEVARANLESARLQRFELVRRDARSPGPPGVTLVLTNPPLGGRVGFGEDVPSLVDEVLRNAARTLRPGGRLVWVSPTPERSLATARRLGLHTARRTHLNLAGLEAEVQRFERR